MKCLGLKWQNVFLFKKIEREATGNAVCARAIYSWPLRNGQEMTQQEICVLSVADVLSGINGSHFMAPQNLPFLLAFSVCVSSNFELR